MVSFRSRALVLGLLTTVAAAPAAAEYTPFEILAGWEVERTVGDTSANPCVMSHGYRDKDDDNAENAVVFKREGANAVIVLSYENWEWEADEKVRAPFAIGQKVVDAKSSWVGNETTLRGVFPGSVIPNLMAAKTVELRIKDREAEFEIPGFAQGYEALLRCDSTPAPGKVAQAPLTPAPLTPPVPVAPAPANPVPAAPTPPAQPAPAPLAQGPLTMVKLQFVSQPAGAFGNIAARGSNAFPAGEKLRSYLEVVGETIRPTATGQRTFSLSLDYEILNAGGGVVGGQKAIIDKEFTLDVPGQPDVFFDIGLNLTGIAPGAYNMVYTLRDKFDGRTATATLPFTITPAPAEARTPDAPIPGGPTPGGQVRTTAFFVGLLAQRTVTECDFPTTARQRSALDAKLASLQPQDFAIEKELRTEVAKNPVPCPDTPDTLAKFQENIRNFVEMTPEAYVELMEKRIAEREAQGAAPKP